MKSEPQAQRSVASSSERDARVRAIGADDSGAFAARPSGEAPGLGWGAGPALSEEPSGFQLAYEAYERELERAARAAA